MYWANLVHLRLSQKKYILESNNRCWQNYFVQSTSDIYSSGTLYGYYDIIFVSILPLVLPSGAVCFNKIICLLPCSDDFDSTKCLSCHASDFVNLHFLKRQNILPLFPNFLIDELDIIKNQNGKLLVAIIGMWKNSFGSYII